MNKKVLFALTMAAMLASCSSSDDALQSSNNLPDTAGIEHAVSFDAYSQRGLTRSGDAGVTDNTSLATKGFGVFGYKTETGGYGEDATPNFMYNQQVTKAGSSWTYEPVKYWANEYGSNAQSDDVDQFSFFAYAPYVVNTPETGKVADDQLGITGFTRNTAQGDPIVKYIGSLDPTKSVDLCWGVCAEADQTWNIIQGGSQTMTAGRPWIDLQRPQKSLGQKVKFTFKHALAQLNVQIDADVNTNAHDQGAEVDANTKVFVRKVTFNGFAMKGALNLNNEVADQPQWVDYSCGCNDPIQSEEYTIYDGMKDDKEGTGYIAGNEKVTGLNEKIIQDKKWTESAEGVTKTAKNLFNNTDANASIYVIPTGDEMSITIEYDIETADANLAGTVSDKETAGISIPNTITKTITLSSDATQKMILEAGKKHTIKLHLGMSQVEFDATVSDWADAADEGLAWLPENGEGDAPVVDPGVALADATQGMFVGANGKAYASKDDATAAGTTAEAWIAYKSATAGESLAFALTDDYPGGTSWNAFNSNPGWSSTPSRAAISGGTWRWPTKTDFDNMLAGFRTLPTTGNGVTSDDSPVYWSSTEYAAGRAWLLGFNGSSSGVYDGSKVNFSSRYYVRAVLAF